MKFLSWNLTSVFTGKTLKQMQKFDEIRDFSLRLSAQSATRGTVFFFLGPSLNLLAKSVYYYYSSIASLEMLIVYDQ